MEPRTKLIIVVGARGVGKSTITNWLREQMVATNLYRITGHADSSREGIWKSKKMYDALMTYLHSMERCGMNILFDGMFISELVFCNLGYRQYDFRNDYKRYIRRLSSLDFDTHILCLHTCEDSYTSRLIRDKPGCLNVIDSVSESMRQQSEYMAVCKQIEMIYPSIYMHYINTNGDWMRHLESLFDWSFRT